MNRIFTREIFSDIRFWIIIFFLIRLYGITLPPLEVGHNWRQTDGLMVARNFYEVDANILYPRVDVAGDKTGIVGSEFPILNYLVYLLSELFGFHDWFGRLIVLITSSIGVFYFYKLISKYFGASAGFNASIILLVSLWFTYSRKTIPDVFSASLCIISVFYATEYLQNGKWKNLGAFFLLAAIACLSKILAAVLLTVLIFPILDKQIALSRKVILSVFSVFVLVVVCLWYFAWVPYLNSTYGLEGHFFMGMSFQDGLLRISEQLPNVLKRFYDTPLKYTGFALLVAATVFAIVKKHWIALGCFLIPFLAFVVLLIKTGSSIIGDHYYILMAIPPMAFMMGFALGKIENKKIVVAILLVIAGENIGNQYHDFRIRPPFAALQSLESTMDTISDRNHLVVVNADIDNPTVMYFAHRKGWVMPNDQLSDPARIAEIRAGKCKFVIVAKELYGDLNLDFPIVFDSSSFKIYKLD